MNATISDPFLLSNYDVSKRFSTGKGVDPLRANLYVSHHRPSGAKEGYATVAVHGDGVHVIDVSDLHLMSSHALGPSTSFACPAVSRTVVENGVSVRKTYAAIASSSETKLEENGRAVWVWSDGPADGSGGKSPEKRKAVVVSLPHRVRAIYTTEDVPGHILFISTQGGLTVTDADLNAQSTQPYPHSDSILFKAIVFSRSSASFTPAHSSPPLFTVVTFVVVGTQTRISVSVIGEDGVATVLDDILPIGDKKLADVSCSSSGHVSLLDCSGKWTSLQLVQVASKITVTQVFSSLQLTQLSFVTTDVHRSSQLVSLLALNSSFVLISSTTPSHEVVILLWDLQYSVLLASHIFPVPSPLSQSAKSGISIELIHASSSQVLISLSPISPEASSAFRSSVLVVPITAPSISTIANAMGRAAAGEQWLIKTSDASDPTTTNVDGDRRTVLDKMRLAMQQHRTEPADTAFFQWAEPGKRSGRRAPNADSFSHEFVRQLLDVVLQPSKPATTLHSPKVIHHLLQRGVVSANMIPGGLIPLLLERKDWATLELALKTVIDISETDLISVLRPAVTAYREQHSALGSIAMDVDASPDVASLPSILSSCVSYSTSAPALRLAFRQQLPGSENVTCILEVLDAWLEKSSTLQSGLALAEAVSKNAHGVSIVSFLRTLLDTFFITLVQYPPSHALLLRISNRLEPELAFIDDVEQLRGPLEPFAKAHAKAIADAVSGARANAPPVDWRKQRKAGREQAAMGIGLYQVEELVI
ncbi:hypothetical protein BV25DRAFT_1792127 [Artomyces pyxidatus]|uniref:Uncharacterized protein n=1 Tax=Artomyces pyxidatus TaxID=48021 RepID=A0ACB8TJL7_9AGAM|nr:hypothetical protein BV25DRAFT_1792127 [Artomyces pyxidatus]